MLRRLTQQAVAVPLAAVLALACCQVAIVGAGDTYDLLSRGPRPDWVCAEMVVYDTAPVMKKCNSVPDCAAFCARQTTRRPYYFKWNVEKKQCKCNSLEAPCRCTRTNTQQYKNGKAQLYRLRPDPLPWQFDKVAEGASCGQSAGGVKKSRNSVAACAKWCARRTTERPVYFQYNAKKQKCRCNADKQRSFCDLVLTTPDITSYMIRAWDYNCTEPPPVPPSPEFPPSPDVAPSPDVPPSPDVEPSPVVSSPTPTGPEMTFTMDWTSDLNLQLTGDNQWSGQYGYAYRSSSPPCECPTNQYSPPPQPCKPAYIKFLKPANGQFWMWVTLPEHRCDATVTALPVNYTVTVAIGGKPLYTAQGMFTSLGVLVHSYEVTYNAAPGAPASLSTAAVVAARWPHL